MAELYVGVQRLEVESQYFYLYFGLLEFNTVPTLVLKLHPMVLKNKLQKFKKYFW